MKHTFSHSNVTNAGFTTEFNFGTFFLEIFFSEEEEEEYHEYDTIEGPRAPL